MEIKVKKEKEPELKLKKEAQVTVHKKNPILSAKEKKAAFTSKPVADLLGQRKKKEGAEKGKQPGQGREALFEKQKEKKKQAGKEAAIRGTAEDRKQNGKTKSTVSVPGTLQPDQMKQGAAPNSQPSAGFRAKEQYRREQAAKLAETKKSSLAKQTAIKGVRRGEAAILTQLEGGEEVNDSLYVMGTAAKPAEKLWKDRNYRKAEQELKVKQADGKITNKQFYKETKAVKKKQMEKQKKQAVRQRKIQYMINKLTGNGQQDSLAQVAKDIVKMKASVFMLKVVQFAGALLAPLFSILLVNDGERLASYFVDSVSFKELDHFIDMEIVLPEKEQEESLKEEYKPLTKVEELEEQNYNMVDNVLNNGFGEKNRREEIRKTAEEYQQKTGATITFFAAVCEEFPSMGDYFDGLTIEQATDKYEKILEDPRLGYMGNGMGLELHDPTLPDYLDGPLTLIKGRTIYADNIDSISYYREHPLVLEAVQQLKEHFPNFKYFMTTQEKQDIYPEHMTAESIAYALVDLAENFETYEFHDNVDNKETLVKEIEYNLYAGLPSKSKGMGVSVRKWTIQTKRRF